MSRLVAIWGNTIGIGIGGSFFGIRAGISTRGFGVGVGPFSATSGYGKRGGSGGSGIGCGSVIAAAVVLGLIITYWRIILLVVLWAPSVLILTAAIVAAGVFTAVRGLGALGRSAVHLHRRGGGPHHAVAAGLLGAASGIAYLGGLAIYANTAEAWWMVAPWLPHPASHYTLGDSWWLVILAVLLMTGGAALAFAARGMARDLNPTSPRRGSGRTVLAVGAVVAVALVGASLAFAASIPLQSFNRSLGIAADPAPTFASHVAAPGAQLSSYTNTAFMSNTAVDNACTVGRNCFIVTVSSTSVCADAHVSVEFAPARGQEADASSEFEILSVRPNEPGVLDVTAPSGASKYAYVSSIFCS